MANDHTSWTLGVVMRDDGPAAEVREGAVDSTSEFRVMQWRALEPGKRKRMDGCSRKPCNLERACVNHNNAAPGWWFEWARREKREEVRASKSTVVEHRGATYTFAPRLPDDNDDEFYDQFWGSISTERGVSMVTAKEAQARHREMTGCDLPEAPNG